VGMGEMGRRREEHRSPDSSRSCLILIILPNQSHLHSGAVHQIHPKNDQYGNQKGQTQMEMDSHFVEGKLLWLEGISTPVAVQKRPRKTAEMPLRRWKVFEALIILQLYSRTEPVPKIAAEVSRMMQTLLQAAKYEKILEVKQENAII